MEQLILCLLPSKCKEWAFPRGLSLVATLQSEGITSTYFLLWRNSSTQLNTLSTFTQQNLCSALSYFTTETREGGITAMRSHRQCQGWDQGRAVGSRVLLITTAELPRLQPDEAACYPGVPIAHTGGQNHWWWWWNRLLEL